MTIYYRDIFGIVGVEVDSTIVFLDGEAWFSNNAEEWRIKIDNIVEIARD